MAHAGRMAHAGNVLRERTWRTEQPSIPRVWCMTLVSPNNQVIKYRSTPDDIIVETSERAGGPT